MSLFPGPRQPSHYEGTCIAIHGKGVLLLGPSGSGKSDLALRLMHEGAELVSDDVVVLKAGKEGVIASAPPTIAGLLEVRGVGIVRVDFCKSVPLFLVIKLVDRALVERIPETQHYDCLGQLIPLLSLHAFDASAPAKLFTAVEALQHGRVVMELAQ